MKKTSTYYVTNYTNSSKQGIGNSADKQLHCNSKLTGIDVTFHKPSLVYNFLHYVVRLRYKKSSSELMTVLRPLMCTSDPSSGVSEAVHLITEILSSAPAQT